MHFRLRHSCFLLLTDTLCRVAIMFLTVRQITFEPPGNKPETAARVFAFTAMQEERAGVQQTGARSSTQTRFKAGPGDKNVPRSPNQIHSYSSSVLSWANKVAPDPAQGAEEESCDRRWDVYFDLCCCRGRASCGFCAGRITMNCTSCRNPQLVH